MKCYERVFYDVFYVLFIDLFKNFYSCHEEAVKDERSIWIYKKLMQICCCPMKIKWKYADWFCFFLHSLNEALVFYHLLNNSKKKNTEEIRAYQSIWPSSIHQ